MSNHPIVILICEGISFVNVIIIRFVEEVDKVLKVGGIFCFAVFKEIETIK